MSDSTATFVLPTGTVTFMLTDVVGSSSAWESDRAAMARAVARHYELLGHHIEAHGGVRPLEQGEGDSVVAAFSRASDAVAAACDAQRALTEEQWPTGAEIEVRMALHTGESQLRDHANYFGPSIIRCARIRDVGHGGQVLLSDTTAALAADQLPAGCSLVELGTHRLRDLGRPERLWQLGHPDLDQEFPPLRSLEAFRQNLPGSLTPLIGRTAAIEELSALLDRERLLTLVGSGGVGKTRLALAVAGERLDHYPSGVWWVDLAPVDDDVGVARAALAAVGVAEAGRGASVAGQVAAELGPQPALLVLDNCEHVIAACADFTAEVLGANAAVTVLATSREPLAVPGEVTWRVPSLAVPPQGSRCGVRTLTQFDAVRLFIERAKRARPSFVVTEENAPDIAQICDRLDGIPLAIELAAARCRQLTPQTVAADLDDRFRLLTGGARTVMPRQQTLAASVAWSFDLLDDPERAVFRRLGVFAGPFPLEAAEAIVSRFGDVRGEEVFDLLSRLVDKNLVVADDTGAAIRYRLLETLRAFASDSAAACEETEDLRRFHAEWWATCLEQWRAAEPTEPVVDQIDTYHDNLVAALRWSHSDPGVGLRLLAQLGRPWQTLGRYGAALAAADELLFAPADLGDHTDEWLAAARGLAVLYVQSGRIDEYLLLLDLLEDVAGRHGDEYSAVTARWLRSGCSLADSIELQRVAQRAGQLWGEALATVTIAEAAVENDPVSAAPLLERAGDVTEATDNSYQRDAHLLTQAKAAIYAGDLSLGADMGHRLLEGRAPANQGAGVAILALVGLLTADEGRIADACEAGARVRSKLLAYPVADFAEGVRELLDGRSRALTPLLDATDPTHFRRYGHLALWVLGRSAVDAGSGDRVVHSVDRWITQWSAAPPDEAGPVPRAVRALVEAAVSSDPFHWHHALRLAADHQLPLLAVDALEGLAVSAAADADWAGALRLLGAAERLRGRTGYCWRFRFERERVEDARAAATAELGDDAERASAEGTSLEWPDAARYAQRSFGGRRRPRHGWDSLTPTEHEVVTLVVQGLTNPQIAERLLVKRSTVKTHLEHIYAKLGVSGRAGLAAQAAHREASQD